MALTNSERVRLGIGQHAEIPARSIEISGNTAVIHKPDGSREVVAAEKLRGESVSPSTKVSVIK